MIYIAIAILFPLVGGYIASFREKGTDYNHFYLISKTDRAALEGGAE